jgi:hypothetical protein
MMSIGPNELLAGAAVLGVIGVVIVVAVYVAIRLANRSKR